MFTNNICCNLALKPINVFNMLIQKKLKTIQIKNYNRHVCIRIFFFFFKFSSFKVASTTTLHGLLGSWNWILQFITKVRHCLGKCISVTILYPLDCNLWKNLCSVDVYSRCIVCTEQKYVSPLTELCTSHKLGDIRITLYNIEYLIKVSHQQKQSPLWRNSPSLFLLFFAKASLRD